MNPNPVLDNLGRTPVYLIDNIIANTYIIDFGIVQAVYGSAPVTSVDVQHAIIPIKFGQQQQATITKSIEVLWPTVVNWDLLVGDTVLLVGLKDFVKSSNISAAATTDIPMHYHQMTMKAIPIGMHNSGSTRVVRIGGSSSSMTLYEALNSALTTLCNTLVNHVHPSNGAVSPQLVALAPGISAAQSQIVKAGS